jgi:hypothetical protein
MAGIGKSKGIKEIMKDFSGCAEDLSFYFN